MTFEELQEKANRRFGRKLTDREIAEIAIEQLNEANEQREVLEEECDSYNKTLSELKGELAEKGRLSELARTLSARIDEILSVPAFEYEIKIAISKDCVPTMDFAIKGNPIRFDGEDDYE